ncbi:MAG: hypothetical protein NTX03_04100 [Bacteroidetes bacterium]|nr:hypothetical protein [Bacteroidota bacterium]
MPEPRKIKSWTEKCGCRKCDTYAVFTKYDCGCIRVEIYNDSKRCAECTDFSGKRYTAPGCR